MLKNKHVQKPREFWISPASFPASMISFVVWVFIIDDLGLLDLQAQVASYIQGLMV